MHKNKPLRKVSKKFEAIKKEEIKRILAELREIKFSDRIPDVRCDDLRIALRDTIALTDTVLNESLTIASDVSRMCMKAGGEIINDISNTKPLIRCGGEKVRKGVYHYQDTFISFDVDWIVRYLSSENELLESYSTGGINVGKHLITVTIFAVNGNINEASLFETLQHEIFHLFEWRKMQHDYLDREAYNHAYNIIRNREPDDESIETMVNRIIYISFAFEQRAFTNGAYQVLMSGGIGDYDEKFANLIKETKIYKWLTACRIYREKISRIPESNKDLSDSLSEYGLTKQGILERADITIESMLRFIGRVRAKAMIDYRKLHNINEYVDVNPFPVVLTKRQLEDKAKEILDYKAKIYKKYLWRKYPAIDFEKL